MQKCKSTSTNINSEKASHLLSAGTTDTQETEDKFLPFPLLKRQVISLMLATNLFIFHVGCGSKQAAPDRAIVSGTVMLGEKPLPGGAITFQSAEHPTGTTIMIVEGNYSTDRAPLGRNIVTVDTESMLIGNASAYVKVPAKYNDPTKSGLVADIKPGENKKLDFTLVE